MMQRLRLTEIHHSRYGKTLGFFGYSVDGRGNRTQVYERIPDATTNAAVIYNGTWADGSLNSPLVVDIGIWF